MAFTKEEIIAELKKRNRPVGESLGRPVDVLTRGAIKGLGAIPDIAALPYNLVQAIRGKEGLPSVSEKLGQGYDVLTGGRHQPQNLTERTLGSVAEFLTGGAGVGKAAGAISQKAGQFLAPKTGLDLASLAGAGVGTELGRELTPESGVGPLLGGLAGGAVPGAAKGLISSLRPNRTGPEALEQIAGQPYLEKGAHIQPVVENLQQTALREREPITQAYNVAREKAATAPRGEFKNFVSSIEKKLEAESIYPEDAPGISGFLKTLGKETSKKEVSVNALEKRRQILNNMIEKAEEHGTKSRSLQAVKNAFDETWDEIIENSLAKSNEPEHAKVLQEFKNARSLNRSWEEKYSTKNPKEFGKKFVGDLIERARNSDEALTPESVVNRMFGTSELGFKEQAPYIYDELAKHLSKEDLQAVSLEALGRIFSPVNKENFGISDARKFKSNWDKFQKQNHTLSDKLFTSKQRRQIDSFANEAASAKSSGILREQLDKLPFVAQGYDFVVGSGSKLPLTLPLTAESARRKPPEQNAGSPYNRQELEAELIRRQNSNL